MKINAKLRKKAAELLAGGKSFAIYRLPDKTPKLVEKACDKVDVYISPWLTCFGDNLHIGEIAESEPSFTLPDATDKETYINRVGELVKVLRKRGMSKTVISRVITVETPGFDWIQAAEDLWNAFPATFGYLFYTPSTGAWLGASPEKLIVTFKPNHFTTHALAGTMPADVDWNRKNYEEQQMVVDFIEDSLEQMHVTYKEIGPKSLVYGSIKHLSTVFSGELDNPEEQTVGLHDWLSPTPALSGLPREEAIDDIDEIEEHDRGCYGGYITLKSDEGVTSYVTIRCVQFDPRDGRWAIYVGGGITPKSEPEAEWEETEAKASTLLGILKESHA